MRQPLSESLPSRAVGDVGPLSGARILIAEDEVIIALELQDIFTDAGAEFVVAAHTVDDALAVIGRDMITAGVLDVRLGIASVFPVADLMVRQAVPFLFYTGQPRNDPARAPWPDVPSVEKPAAQSKLLSAMCALLHRPVG